MKKKIILGFVVALFGIGIFVVCASKIKDKEIYASYNQYLVYNNEEKTLEGKQIVEFYNYTGNILKEVKLHLYPNAFREGAKAKIVSLANFDKAYPNGLSYGNINIESASSNNESLTYEICGDDENILKINIPFELYPQDIFVFEIGFSVKLPNANHRFGYGENTINICNYYPILCVYENGDFVQDLYDSNGDPFYSKVSNYNVEIEYDKSLVLASSGKAETRISQNKKITKISALKVRDFAMVLSEKFQECYEDYKGIEIRYYYYDDVSSVQTVEVIKQVLDLNKKFGSYPYKTLSVAEANFVHGGMEYPGLVLISDDLADYNTYVNVVVHELCHQWWYGVVGNNQYKYGFLDEGLTDFNTSLFYDKYPAYQLSSEDIYKNALNSYKTFLKTYSGVYDNFTPTMLRSLNEFDTEYEYVYCTYVKGMLMFFDLQELLGQNKFNKCLKYYYECFKFKEATPYDLIKCFNRASGKNLTSWFESWFEGNVLIGEK